MKSAPNKPVNDDGLKNASSEYTIVNPDDVHLHVCACGVRFSNLSTDIKRIELEARKDELRHLIADTLEPEQVGGKFIHEPVREFTKQQKEFIKNRLAQLGENKG